MSPFTKFLVGASFLLCVQAAGMRGTEVVQSDLGSSSLVAVRGKSCEEWLMEDSCIPGVKKWVILAILFVAGVVFVSLGLASKWTFKFGSDDPGYCSNPAHTTQEDCEANGVYTAAVAACMLTYNGEQVDIASALSPSGTACVRAALTWNANADPPTCSFGEIDITDLVGDEGDAASLCDVAEDQVDVEETEATPEVCTAVLFDGHANFSEAAAAAAEAAGDAADADTRATACAAGNNGRWHFSRCVDVATLGAFSLVDLDEDACSTCPPADAGDAASEDDDAAVVQADDGAAPGCHQVWVNKITQAALVYKVNEDGLLDPDQEEFAAAVVGYTDDTPPTFNLEAAADADTYDGKKWAAAYQTYFGGVGADVELDVLVAAVTAVNAL